MCGIVGIVNTVERVDRHALQAMRDSFVYRGPDDAGLWLDGSGHVGLGHRRLSILDPTPAGQQPMLDKSNGNVIVFNGEVFNYIEIRQELEEKGYQFTTGTDTEVILSAYDAYGERCVEHFNGMFAIAIWDAQQQRLFIARDRLGIKPFYYHQASNGSFSFASEVKAIRTLLQNQQPLNIALIDQYMSFGYIPGESTLEQGIFRLLPGHRGYVENGVVTIEQYWDLKFGSDEDLGFDYYLHRSKELLNSAIDLRLRSDVPLGIFLSGGIDSSAVVGLLAERTSEQLKTFSVAYDFGKDFDETHYARLVAERFNTDHHELFVTEDRFQNFIPEFSHLMDEPVTESAAISLQFISQMAKDSVTVVLSGEGSDEIFGGYDLYRYMTAIEHYRRIVSPPVASMIAKVGTSVLPTSHKLSKYLHLSSQPLAERYKGISTYEERTKNLLYRADFMQLIQQGRLTEAKEFQQSLFDQQKNADALSQMLYFDTKTWLVDDLLIKADRMSMSASLELRVPFLDYRLVEFAAAIPSKYKIRNGQGKYILKKMMEGLLPNEIIYRKKMGFPTPLKRMFQGELATYTADMLTSPNTHIQDFFKREVIQGFLREHLSGKTDHHRVLWQLIVLEEWMRGYHRGSKQ